MLSGMHMHRIGGWLQGSRDLPAVIGYHRVVEDYESASKGSIPSQLVSLKMLERHLDWIGQRFRFLSLDEVGSRLESGDPSKVPAAAITFDDGYRDFYECAFPLLQRKGIPAAVFVVTDLIGTTDPHAHDKLYLLLVRRRRALQTDSAVPDISRMTPYQAMRALIENLPVSALQKVIAALEAEDPIPADSYRPFQSMSWEMLDKIERAGIAIGSHTKSHVLLTGERDELVREEVDASRRKIKSRLGVSVKHFAYPSGQFNPGAISAVRKAGYRYAYTGCLHRSKQHPLLTIPRTILWENSSVDSEHFFSPAILHCQIHHSFDLVSGCRHSDHFGRNQ